MKPKLKFKMKVFCAIERFYIGLFGVVITFYCLSSAASTPSIKSENCLSCHNYDINSPAQIMLNSKHGNTSNIRSPMALDGCQSCHGESAKHTKSPTKVSPDVSFGPHWTAHASEQNAPCLLCHQDGVARNWEGNTHANKELACASCHDLHTANDKVLGSAQSQSNVCTICHKVQKEGVHTLKAVLSNNPSCTQCHNPHADSISISQIIQNRSLGCRSCHELSDISDVMKVSAKAASYHKTMSQVGRSCIDCHKSIVHAPADNVDPIIPSALASQTLTLFFPAQTDLDWLLTEHPGSQEFRQGYRCQQCHRGDEKAMGESLSGTLENATINADVKFERSKNSLLLNIAWLGDKEDSGVALMWGASNYETFARTGCWASCHSDMPNMSRDHGQGLSKYLAISRAQVQRIGLPPQVKTERELKGLIASNQFVYMWRVTLKKGVSPSLETARLLATLEWESGNEKKSVQATYKNGAWQVQLSLPLSIVHAGENTFGIAIHGAGRSGEKHWVSLPQTFSFHGESTDFTVK